MPKMKVLALLSFLALLFVRCNASCSTYQSACDATVGTYISSGGSQDISLPSQAKFYFKFEVGRNWKCLLVQSYHIIIFYCFLFIQVAAATTEASVLISNVYGAVELFAAIGREPTATDNDFSLIGNGVNDLLKMVSNISYFYRINLTNWFMAFPAHCQHSTSLKLQDNGSSIVRFIVQGCSICSDNKDNTVAWFSHPVQSE